MEDNENLLVHYMGQGGVMEGQIPGFRFRREQMNLAEYVLQAFTDETFLVAEAGTGVGKTFAYLLPAVLWSTDQKEKVVMSTRTKALQQQIVDRDLPDLARILDRRFMWAEAKGRDNFLCWNKYMNILAGRKNLNEGEQRFVESILQWAEKTRTGDRKELHIASDLLMYWPLVAADRMSCQKERCHYRDKCFRLKMLKRMEKADLIIVNHSLLLSDLMVDNSILPSYEYLIVDEVHTFLKESFDKLSLRFSLYELMDSYKMLYQRDGKTQRGYLLKLQNRFSQIGLLINEVKQIIDTTVKLTSTFFRGISQGISYGENYNYSHIIKPVDRGQAWYTEAIAIYVDWQYSMHLLILKLKNIEEELGDAEESLEIQNFCSSLQELSDVAYYLMEEKLEKEDQIQWLEYERGKAVCLCASAINSGEVMNEQLYKKLKSAVMVSATLAVDDSFDNFISRSGLMEYQRDGRILTLLEDSPFNYRDQASLVVVQDLPDPADQRFSKASNDTLLRIINQTRGKTMILFTARRQLEEASSYLRDKTKLMGVELLTQYENGEFAVLMEAFKANEHAVLMGLETFWEGIDLKGEQLTCLVIVKIPFRSPSDPFCSAWDKYYRFHGKSSFEHFMLPDAAVRFKQGVGRLIRSENDHGAVVVLDTRLVKKRYGKTLMRSIPIHNVQVIDSENIEETISPWL
ncbi:MAG: helicase C-terminal domain-containing protein [Bacillota bacterium]|nr:helicase C-terminal domain-containing protein [Bacillota bacterium]